MKLFTKRVIGTAAAAVLTFALISFSCARTTVKGSAGTAYAETSTIKTDAADLKVVEALQNSFRSISTALLPAVVEVDVTETKTMDADPFENFRFFFFGNPNQGNDENDGGKKRKYEQKGLGSGVIVRRTGNTIYVLTNNHVAGEATKISIKLNDEREFEGKLVGADERMDIALVSFESGNARNRKRKGTLRQRHRQYKRFYSNRCGNQSGKFGRASRKHLRRSHRNQHVDCVPIRRLARFRLRNSNQQYKECNRFFYFKRQSRIRLARRIALGSY